MFLSIKDFISEEERLKLIELRPQNASKPIDNEHIKAVNDATNGYSVLCDLSKTDISSTVAKFQGDNTKVNEVAGIYYLLEKRIAETLKISSEHVFFQYICLGAKGQVKKHYDAGHPGYVTYKCNISLHDDEDVIFVDGEEMVIPPRSLYCFEANFYKHWMNVCDKPRNHLSYGFLVPYSDLGWDESSPRVRLSNRIWKVYIK